MIVRTDETKIQLITQPDHAHLARRVMESCASLRMRTSACDGTWSRNCTIDIADRVVYSDAVRSWPHRWHSLSWSSREQAC